MTNLNDTQLVLLSTASQRETSSIYPLPGKFASAGKRVTDAVDGLIKLDLAEERETADHASITREDGDLRYGLFATAAGLKAIGIEDGADEGAAAPIAAPPAPAFERVTKAGAVLMLLQRESGATLADLIAATNWLPHTTRAALTGLRKKGHSIERGKRGGVTFYRIGVQA